MRLASNFIGLAIVTAALGVYYGVPMAVRRADARRLLPGTTSPGHVLIEERCEACHAAFRGVSNDACNRCHGEDLALAEDSHPESKFVDPRNADRIQGLDARACVTCHREHVPARTHSGGVTLPTDFCVRCHENIARERPSHRGFAFDGCASTGCHRFHDNRALYENYLAQHLREPDVLPTPAVPQRLASGTGKPAMTEADADGPFGAQTPAILREWVASAHARACVTCTDCHALAEPATGMLAWKDHPGLAACSRCHGDENAGFLKGKHGMRLSEGLSPMTPALAQLPMKPGMDRQELGCDTCHPAHSADTRRAAVEACLGCHDDRHSQSYRASRHHDLWNRETLGDLPPGSGVSCATCHLPRQTLRRHGADTVQGLHNQNANLRPVDTMLRSVCVRCHGLGFSIDALADVELGRRNYNGRPSVHVASLDMVERRIAEKKTK